MCVYFIYIYKSSGYTTTTAVSAVGNRLPGHGYKSCTSLKGLSPFFSPRCRLSFFLIYNNQTRVEGNAKPRRDVVSGLLLLRTSPNMACFTFYRSV